MARIARVAAHRLQECEITGGRWALFTKWKTSEEWIDDETFGKKWVSPTCVLHNPNDGLVYVGMTSLGGDVFYAFDPRTDRWESLHYPGDRDRYGSKIHQCLELDAEGRIYGGIATLGDVDIWPRAPGGALFRFDPRTREYEFLCIPIAHDYIQATVMDRKRGILYGDTFPGRKLFRYDIATNRARELTMLGNIAMENLAMDADGGVWHTYEMFQWAGRYPLLRYDPDRDEIDFLNVDLPDIGQGVRRAANQIDSSLLTKDGRLYIGTSAGVLAQVDRRGPKITYLGKPLAAPRLKGLIEGEDGLIYGACGAEYDTHVFTYDPASRVFTDLGSIVDSRDGTRCWLAHHMCRVDARTFIVAECDNHARASFLFKVELEG
jgi:hypothetical protein